MTGTNNPPWIKASSPKLAGLYPTAAPCPPPSDRGPHPPTGGQRPRQGQPPRGRHPYTCAWRSRAAPAPISPGPTHTAPLMHRC